MEKQKHIEKIESLQGEGEIVYELIAGKQDELQKAVQWEVMQAKEHQTVELVDEICQKKDDIQQTLEATKKTYAYFSSQLKAS